MPTIMAAGDFFSTAHDHAISTVNVLNNDFNNNNNDPLTATIVSGPSHGSYTLGSNGALSYTPDALFAGTDSLTYQAAANGETSQATVSLTVTNNAPLLWGQSISATHDHVVHNINLLANSFDIDGDTLQVSIVSGPSHGTLAQGSTTWDYTPTAGWTGSDSATITATDGIATSFSATISFNVTNATPMLSGQTLSIGHDQVLTDIDVLANATDNDGDTLTPTIVSDPNHGELVANDDGTFNYYADAGWTGSDSFTVSASDGLASSSTVTFSISVTNATPTASNASFAIEHDQILPGIDLNQYVSDTDYDSLDVIIVSGPSHGDWTQNDDGTYIYTPDAQFVGYDTITIKANDGVADSSTATITINVTTYAPTSNNSYTLLHDHTLPSINFALNDMEAMGDPSVISILSGPSHGTLTQNSDGTYDLRRMRIITESTRSRLMRVPAGSPTGRFKRSWSPSM